MAIFSELVEPSCSSSIDRHRYDVFLSFRGADTRYGFTNHLYKALEYANITTFLDDTEIETGEYLKPDLESVIQASRASIIVLSRNYASSTWCLDELVLILDQRRASNQIVIPVLYHVEPTHVRNQQSTFGYAMNEHNRKMEAETDANKRSEIAQKIERWKKALTEVADLERKDVNGRLETEFIEEIVKDIYSRLRISSRSHLPQLFGMYPSIKFITSWLKDASLHTRDILTILGISGIGKTSLAKYVYDLHSYEFDKSCFIEDISRRCDEKLNRSNGFNGLLYLQKQLYDDISEPSSGQVHDGLISTPMIENAVARKKVFLVLDDIDHLNQLDALLGSKGFHPGSKIIITTTNSCLGESCALFKMNVKRRHIKHLLRGLHETESRKLLCSHAFMSKDPKAGYEEVSKKLVKYCEGHPLALEVLGKSLHNRDLAYWEECLEGLKQGNDSPINNILRKSFNTLPSPNDKDLFKHIACFFVGMDRDVSETILKSCGIETISGIKILTDRCLLSIGRNNKLMMHGLLQEMGRFVVREESPDKPWKQSLLWCPEESFEVLKQKKGTTKILGLSLDMSMLESEKSHKTFELNTDAFRKMDKLMLLQLINVQISGSSYENFPQGLRWLCIHGFCLKSIPSDLPMANLVALDMSRSKIKSFDICYSKKPKRQKQLTGSCSKNKRLLGSLKILNLSFCKKLGSLGGFDQIPALERLVVTNCSALCKVCESIEECVELVLINFSYCKKLEKLPRTIGMLNKVKILLLDGFYNLNESQVKGRDVDSPDKFKANTMDMNTKPSSPDIPMGIPSELQFVMFAFPRSLVRLSLKTTNLLKESFPIDFNHLSNLEELYLDGYNLGESRIEISDMTPLEMFKASNRKPSSSAMVLKATPSERKLFMISLPRSLVRLSLNDNNMSTESFPMDLSFISMLKELYLDGNPIVSMPDCVRSLPRLEILSMRNCKFLTSVEHPPKTLRELILLFDSKPLLRKVVFHPHMSPLKFSVDMQLFLQLFFEIKGLVEIQPMISVEEEVLRSLGWTNILSRGYDESEIQMYYEFGIFSTIYGDKKEMPNWISHSRKGSSISFTIPSSRNNIKGLNLCVQTFLSLNEFFDLPVITIRNITKNQTWLYKHCIGGFTAGEESLIMLSHWMFGKNEMDTGDWVTVTVAMNFGLANECGVSFVFDDGKTDEEEEEEDALGYYKSWNHIIGGDLSAYQTTTGEYLLETSLFALPGNEPKTYYRRQR
ncbi:disease resistance protein RUN1 isoform X1 [Lactuca sativa]|uniref:TIR domain-containing protein n=1 Tax=Lactuca sativa TaxID=4236 RepID=A0A9R1WIG1_LACSA|nr:disease resistance protein RUN1 isoform X1 [Lactuca sativa]KAJ0225800.1 hypothetical protein LSAT_V11C100031570 [Lactuca sativa]